MRRVNEATFPRTKRLADFDASWVPDLPPAALAPGRRDLDRRRTACCSATPGPGGPSCSSHSDGSDRAGSPRPLRDHRSPGQRARRSRRRQAALPGRGQVRPDSICCVWTRSATSTSTPVAPNCCSRTSPPARRGHRSLRVQRTIQRAPSPTPRLAAAVVDRLTFNAHIIQTGTTSYRLTTSRRPTGRKDTNPA